MRLRLALLLLVVALPMRASAAVAFSHVWTSYRTAASFKSIAEYFGAKERTGRDRVLRSQPTVRDGYYFLARIKSDQPATGAVFLVEVILPGSPEVKSYRFSADVPQGRKTFQLGLTGADWPGARIQPTAWRVTVQDAAGAELGSSQSYLWSNGPAP